MNLKQAKRLRKMIGYHPSEQSTYDMANRRPVLQYDEEGKIVVDESGQPVVSHYSFTIVNAMDSKRKFYQSVKRKNKKI